jgi:hypothetical protein
MIKLTIQKLRQYMEIIPVLLFLLNGVLYLLYVLHVYYEISFLSGNLYWSIKHICETSLISISVMVYVSIRDRWSIIPKICLISLFCLWLNNIPTIVFNINPDGYFFIFASVIYITGVILSLWVLTRR